MRRGLLGRLAARQECDRRNRGGNRAQQAVDCCIGHLIHRRLFGTCRAGNHHVGLQNHSFQHHTLHKNLAEYRSLHFFRHFKAPLQRVIAIHQNFRLNNWNKICLLA